MEDSELRPIFEAMCEKSRVEPDEYSFCIWKLGFFAGKSYESEKSFATKLKLVESELLLNHYKKKV